MFEKITAKIKESNSIIIFPHTSMDGDSVACSKALYLVLTALGKNVVILTDEAVPDHVSFLGGPEFFLFNKYIADLFKLRYQASFNNPLDKDFYYDLAIAVDCSDSSRIENRIEIWDKAKYKVCIDHHPGKNDFADIIVRDEKASAAALLIYKLIQESSYILNKDIASAIYTGIITDTGAFKYSNTNADTFKVASELLSYGIDHSYICSKIFDNKPLEQLEIEAYALDNVELFYDGRLAVSSIPYLYWTGKDVPYSYTESSIDIIRSIKGVEIAVLLKEKEPKVFKASLRAKTYANVQQIAQNLGGGGHEKAAACTLEMTLIEAKKTIVNEVELAL